MAMAQTQPPEQHTTKSMVTIEIFSSASVNLVILSVRWYIHVAFEPKPKTTFNLFRSFFSPFLYSQVCTSLNRWISIFFAYFVACLERSSHKRQRSEMRWVSENWWNKWNSCVSPKCARSKSRLFAEMRQIGIEWWANIAARQCNTRNHSNQTLTSTIVIGSGEPKIKWEINRDEKFHFALSARQRSCRHVAHYCLTNNAPPTAVLTRCHTPHIGTVEFMFCTSDANTIVLATARTDSAHMQSASVFGANQFLYFIFFE